MRVILHKITESESNLNSIPIAEPAAAYQSFNKSVQQNKIIFENKNESLHSNANNKEQNNLYNSSLIQSEFLVGSGRKDYDSTAERELERAKFEMQNLNIQLISLQSANAELNAKIKNASEQPKTSNI